jgi:hypothetical protein
MEIKAMMTLEERLSRNSLAGIQKAEPWNAFIVT